MRQRALRSTILHVAQESEPGRTSTIRRRMVMRRKNPADDILIDRYTEGQNDLLGNARTSPTGITLLHFNNSTNQIRTWAFRTGLRSVFWGKQQPVFSIKQRAMEIQQG